MTRRPPIVLPAESDGRDPLTREALTWLVFLHSGDETAQDWEDFQDWKAVDEAHFRAARQAEELWETLGPALTPQRKSGRKPLPVLLAVMLGVAALAFAASWFGSAQWLFADYHTWTGEIRSVTLRDGSRVDIDSGTSFDVDAQHRTITLHGGQIFVTVKPDRGRPFTVVAGKARIRALGTAFGVRREGGGGNVVVTEHAVRVTLGGPDASPGADIAAGQVVSYREDRGLGEPHRADVSALTAWRRGELVFDGRPLGEVMTEIGRYHRGAVFILDDSIRRLPVTGNVDIADVNSFLESIQLGLPVIVTRFPAVTLIRRDYARTLPSR